MSLTQLTDLQPTNIKVTGIATFDQKVGIAGTLTYQDVTNVDAVGIITARNGINVSGGNITIENAEPSIFFTDTNANPDYKIFNDQGVLKIYDTTNSTTRFQITSAGIVTTTGNIYADNMFLNSGLTLNNNGNPAVNITSTSTTGSSRIFFGDPDSALVGRITYEHNGDYMPFYTAYGERLRITSDGKVGIGITNPSQKFTVQGTILKTRSDSGTGLIYLQNDASNNGNILINQNAGVTRVKLDSAGDSYFNGGNVGIGEVSPATILHVKANVGDLLRLDRNNTGAVGNQIAFRHSNSGTLTETGSINCVSTANADTGELRFYTKASGGSNTERVRIKSDGTVVFNNTINSIHTNSNDSKLVLFGGSSNSVSNGGVLSLHGITHSGGNYTDLSAGTGGYIQFRSGTSEKFRITAGGEVLCGLTTTGTDATRNTTLHAGTMMRVSNFYMGRVHQSSNNGNAAIVLHKLGQNQGFQMSGSMTFHSYTGSAYLSGCIVSRYNNDDVTRDVSLQKANSGMNLQLVEGTISGVSGTFLAIKKNGGGTGVCYINGFFGGNIEAYGGIREVSNSDWTTTTVHGTGITGGNDSSSS